GAAHRILGAPVAHGVRGLNPGVALGPRRVLDGAGGEVDPGAIYVLPATPPGLKPVAGVLAMDEGNLLSHVQLLARNLGIPNASVSPSLLGTLQGAEGREVFYAVSPLGRVLLEDPANLTDELRALAASGQPAAAERYRLDTSRLRLDVVRPVPLHALRAEQSGVVVGPKAANLGQLAADFPGRVSRGVALPFGTFVRHVSRPFEGSRGTVLEELRAAYDQAAQMRVAGLAEGEVNALMLERLAWVRAAIEGLDWVPEARDQVVEALNATLDGDVSRGVFVRSDTNVEDLPQFSGAGLNLTVAHQTSVEDVLASIKRVWTSPFSERAYLWRSQVLEDQGDVYPSVLLQQSVPSERSGVLITAGLQEGGPDDVTVVTAEGVGGAVEGEDAETLVVGRDGSVRLLSQAKAARARELTRGGTRWVVAERPDTLLRPDELAQLLDVVEAWKAKKAGTPDADTIWDMEFGFVQGRLWLFQIRPFIRYRDSDVYTRLRALDDEALGNAARVVRLADPVGAR
ncbi:MAG TPA: PEP/pyruvate-binding domain-containing protein, partial [Longimicrobiales bacterium]|nr:PEP/pyruvate-binding domain-containing protein [Longimicrobiales bacterium]